MAHAPRRPRPHKSPSTRTAAHVPAPGFAIVSERAAPSVRRGHPWVFREALTVGPDAATGDSLRLRDAAGNTLGVGLYDARSPIAVRVWARADEEPIPSLFGGRAEVALALRDPLFAGPETTAFRCINGEGDRMPGVVVDRYGDVVVLRLDGDAVEAHLAALVDALWPALERRGAVSLVRKQRGARMESLRGPAPPARITVREHGMPFWVDLEDGQKTGAFLDQRENRARVRRMAAGRRVLNLFSYAGGFSLAAALGGATTVTSVDVAAAAHKTAQDSFRLAGVDTSRHRFAAADAFAWLAAAAARGETFDLVISDPPSFAPNEKAVPRALQSYRDLHRACARLLAPNAIFCASSCSSHVGMEAFLSTLDDETLGPRLRALEVFGPPADHPTLPVFPEGRYLKFVVLG